MLMNVNMVGVKFRRNFMTTMYTNTYVYIPHLLSSQLKAQSETVNMAERDIVGTHTFLSPMCVDRHTYLHTCTLIPHTHTYIHTKQ